MKKGDEMIKKLTVTIAVLAAMSAMLSAKEKSLIYMSVASYQQIVVRDKKGHIQKDKNGKPVKKWVKASKVVPGYVVKYVDVIHNDSNTTLKNATVANPIDPNLLFIADSAKSDANMSVTYSVNKGKSFDTADKLMVLGTDKKMHPARPKDYNAISFTINKVPAHSKVEISYKVKLK